MAVYVDTIYTKWKGKTWCHLTADTIEELHAFAKKLGLKKEWFQVSRAGIEHYDITYSKRSIAINIGARILTKKDLREKIYRDFRKIKKN